MDTIVMVVAFGLITLVCSAAFGPVVGIGILVGGLLLGAALSHS